MIRNHAPQRPAVLHLISSLEVGGAERMLVNFIQSCAEVPPINQIVVVMNDRVDRNLASELRSTSVPVYFLGRPESSKNPKYIIDLVKIIRAHRVSIIHSHNSGSKYWSILCRLAMRKLRLIFTLHDTKIRMSSLDVLLHNATIDATIAISKAVATEARSLKINRIDQVDNGVPISFFRSVSPQPCGSPAKIISVARLLPEKKGQDILIRAIKRCVDRGLDVECTLVGSPMEGDSQTLPRLQALVSTLQLTSRVHFLTGRSDVPALLGSSNIFVLPSRYEGFGLALVEAMAAGLPVIASNIDGPADIITDGKNGLLFESGSDEQLAARIATLIQSAAVTEKLCINGRATASNYDISSMRDRYIAIYRHFMADD